MRRPHPSHVSAALAVVLCAPAAPAATPSPRDARSAEAAATVCPDAEPRLKVLTLGSSTMYSPLGRMIAKRLGRRGVPQVVKHARSASGLARPDFYDWPEQAGAALKEHKPGLVIVSMGGNDGQALKHRDGTWTRLDPPDWERELGRRVDGFLKLLAGRKRKRRVIWIGPQAAATEKGSRRRKRVNDVVRERVAAFDGQAWFIDVVGRTLGEGGVGKLEFTPPGAEAPIKMRSKSGAHLTRAAVRWTMLEPAVRLLDPCLPKPARATKPKPKPKPRPQAAPQPAGDASPPPTPAAAKATDPPPVPRHKGR